MAKASSPKPENESAFKHLFGRELLQRLGHALKVAYPSFDVRALSRLFNSFGELEMKPRVRAIRDEIKRQLPEAYPEALRILLKSIELRNLKGFDLWPYTEFIQAYGFDHPKISLEALSHITTLFTAEWAVRPFLNDDPSATLKFLNKAAAHPNHHVRRWASEGSRPRLPWGERLKAFIQDPTLTRDILERLKHDENLYVRKSVANHLNDIAKDNPDYVIETLQRWGMDAPAKHESKIKWITARAARTLIKMGHPEALKLIGVSASSKVLVENLTLSPKVLKFGDSLHFSFEITSLAAKPQKTVIDYVVHFLKSNGKTSPKVFKLKTMTLEPRAQVKISKSHPVRPITTRTYFPGKQKIEIQVNGKSVAQADWKLKL